MKKASGGLMAFVKAQCANLTADNECLGVNIKKDLRNVQFREQGKCFISESKPCLYFEQCVLGPRNYRYREAGFDYERLFEAYAQINPAYLSKLVKIRRCDCGEPLAARAKYCANCKRKRRQETSRKNQRRHYQKCRLAS